MQNVLSYLYVVFHFDVIDVCIVYTSDANDAENKVLLNIHVKLEFYCIGNEGGGVTEIVVYY